MRMIRRCKMNGRGTKADWGAGEGQDGRLTSQVDAHQRIKRVPGSFVTEGEMAYKLGGGRGCDVMVMKNILHHWGDIECLSILRNVRDAMLRRAGWQTRCGIGGWSSMRA